MNRRGRILVTGATGRVGRQVVAQLMDAGAEVRALARDPHAARLRADIEVMRGDLTQPHTLHAPLDGVDAVFLVWPFATAEGMSAVLDVVAEHARRVVYLSSAAVRDHEQRAEQLIEQTGVEWTFLRPHVFAANALRWAAQVRAAGAVHGPYGAAAMAPIHQHDIAAVAVQALTGNGHGGAIYELTGPQTLSQSDQVRIIGEVIDRPVHWIETPAEVERQQMLELGWPGAAVDGILHAQAELVTKPGPITSTVEQATGTPARTFREWVIDHSSAFRDT
ncbi:SDR family oxidoreductase [Nonomuraea sediminis]|uniref:SDR family oxidoreductase n=1 Tax=Nonomuraea sediminis TaxID=2835864 RepID=UPI001BDD1551|nr:NAD(P)H-binding protein [Nonomuraea sediminis]